MQLVPLFSSNTQHAASPHCPFWVPMRRKEGAAVLVKTCEKDKISSQIHKTNYVLMFQIDQNSKVKNQTPAQVCPIMSRLKPLSSGILSRKKK